MSTTTTPKIGGNIDPTDCIAIVPPHGSRPRFGKHPREVINTTVDRSTLRQITTWRGKGQPLSIGLVVDQLVRFARKGKFKTVRK